MPEIQLDDIESTTRSALLKHGADPAAAAEVAKAVRVAEANGNKICGLYYLDSYCTQLGTGRVDGSAQPVVTSEKPGAVRVDAKFGFAQVAFGAGFSTAVEAARANGTVGFSVEHTHTCTSLGYFTEQFAREGLIAIGTTNAPARVAPPGGNTAVLGTNPIAMAVPDGDGGIAMAFDFSTSAIALGKITMAAAAGDPIPLGWAVDEHGDPTTDAEAALRGSLVSAGGYKGYGIGLMVEVLAAALTGGQLSIAAEPLKAPTGGPHDLGQFYLVIDPQAYSGSQFHDQMRALAAAIEAQEGARMPGSARRTPGAVEVEPEVWASVTSLAGD